MISELIQLGHSISQKEAETMDVNWTHPLAKVRGVSLVTSSQQARWWFPDMEQISFRVVSIWLLLPPTPLTPPPPSAVVTLVPPPRLPAEVLVSGGAGRRVVVTGAVE